MGRLQAYTPISIHTHTRTRADPTHTYTYTYAYAYFHTQAAMHVGNGCRRLTILDLGELHLVTQDALQVGG